MTQFSHLNRKIKIPGLRRHTLERARGRMVLVSFVMAFGFMLVAARSLDLAVIQGNWLAGGGGADIRAQLDEMRPAADDVLRGRIYDRNGEMLAATLSVAGLYADPKLVKNKPDVAAQLAAILPDTDVSDIEKLLARSGRFVWLSRQLTPAQQEQVLRIGSPGLGFREVPARIYPQGGLAPHIVGYTDIDLNGLAGIERAFDAHLKRGEDIHLSLDTRLQHLLRREAQDVKDEFTAKAAAGVVVDITSGEILAAVSLPDFDPHKAGDAQAAARFNRFSLAVYELGSTFKIFSTAALLNRSDVSMAQTYDAREPLKRGRHTIADFHPEERVLSLPEVFIHSSNIGSALMGEAVGTAELRRFYADLGLFDAPEVEIGEVGRPLYPEPWRDINTLTAAYGHGIAVSPLQLVRAAAAIVGDGTLRQLTVLDRGKMPPVARAPDREVLSGRAVHRMRQLMRLAVVAGTGASADVPGYLVGGKTGTADKPVGGRYDGDKRISSFLGVFPMNAPRYAVFVMLDEPQGTRRTAGYATGGWVAAPAVQNVITGMAAILNIPPQRIAPEDDLSAALMKHVKSEDELKKESHLASF